MAGLGLHPGYVLDEIEVYEIESLLKHSHLRHKENWEIGRFLGYVTANCAGAKLQKMSDLVRFPWEDESARQKAAEAWANYDRLKALSAQTADILNGNTE